METVFWIAFSVLLYTYAGYGLLLLVANAFQRQPPLSAGFMPSVTLIIPAYNEAGCIAEKIEASLRLQYPPGGLFIIVVTDGSTDGTVEIAQRYPQITLLHSPQRQGKTAAINRAVQVVQTEYVVFTDANAVLSDNSLPMIMRHYHHARIGGVSGEKRIAGGEASGVGFGEGLYWRYESLLKKANADFYTVVGAAGELFSVRTALYKPVAEDTIADDFAISANVCAQGYRMAYEPAAVAAEPPSLNMTEERKRKVRISAGCFQALGRFAYLLNPFRNPLLAFQFLSHRVLRWVACPLALPLLFVTSVSLWIEEAGLFYTLAFYTQCVFYGLALAGWLRQDKGPQALLPPYYFVFMHACLYAGFFRFIRGGQSARWDKAIRKPSQ